MRDRRFVVSFFDYTGHAVRPWAEAGYTCICADIQHKIKTFEPMGRKGGGTWFLPADLSPDGEGWNTIRSMVGKRPVVMVFGFPPCTDLAVSGARHFAKKAKDDPAFQQRAVAMAVAVADWADTFNAPYVIENPRSVLSTQWRPRDHSFDPYHFGGYLPEDDIHPRHPKYIAPRDAYTKDTWHWTGNGYRHPPARPVEPEILERVTRSGRTIRGSRQFMKLGGSGMKTKNIRNETPRGWALAAFQANEGR